MTQQEAFNHVWKTFIIEGAPRSANSWACVYGHPDKIGCAIACLCPPDVRQQLYKSELGDQSGDVETMYGRGIDFPKVLGLDLEFLHDLQNCHDNAESGEYFHSSLHEHLERMALRYGLKVPA
jgi:hypothetical protein